MGRTKPLGVYGERKQKIRKTLENRMNDSSLGATDLERRGIIKRGIYYRRLREAGDIRLKEIWGMEAAGVRFTDEDLLAMFGRGGEVRPGKEDKPMKIEDLAKRLRESGNIEKCCLAAVIEHECKRIETESFEGIGKTVYYLNGCIEAICAFGEITEAEKRELCVDIDARAYGGPAA